jgi:hypothetical protein
MIETAGWRLCDWRRIFGWSDFNRVREGLIETRSASLLRGLMFIAAVTSDWRINLLAIRDE